MKFIQFIGTQRSGSNLLRMMLNQLPQISAPHPPHILENFNNIWPIYSDIHNDTNFKSLVNDVCTWVELNPVPWNIISFDRAKIQKSCKVNTLIELLYVVYAYFAELHNSEYACCKSMSNVHRYRDLEAAGLGPYYIYLHRDGRDVACSFKKAMVGEKHVYHIARQWKFDQDQALKVKENIPSDRFFEVKYQDLITNPKSILVNLCDFLDVQFNEIMLEYFNAEESITTAKSGDMWKNLSHPIIKNNYNKYLKELSGEEIELFERIAGVKLEELGYSVSSDYESALEFTDFEIEDFNFQNNNLKNLALEKANKHDIELRCPQKELLETLLNKLPNKTNNNTSILFNKNIVHNVTNNN